MEKFVSNIVQVLPYQPFISTPRIFRAIEAIAMCRKGPRGRSAMPQSPTPTSLFSARGGNVIASISKFALLDPREYAS
jgi:hypothetical protein